MYNFPVVYEATYSACKDSLYLRLPFRRDQPAFCTINHVRKKKWQKKYEATGNIVFDKNIPIYSFLNILDNFGQYVCLKNPFRQSR